MLGVSGPSLSVDSSCLIESRPGQSRGGVSELEFRASCGLVDEKRSQTRHLYVKAYSDTNLHLYWSQKRSGPSSLCGSPLINLGIQVPSQKVRLDPPGTYITTSNTSPYL